MSKINMKLNLVNGIVDENNKSKNINEELKTNNSTLSSTQNQENIQTNLQNSMSMAQENIGIDSENELNNKKLITLKNSPEVKTVTPGLKIEQKIPEKPLIMMEEKEEIFINYDSDFKKNEKTIMQRMRNLKMIPKTRTGFLLLFVWFAFFIIALFFIFDSKHHSIDIYKANLMAILGNKNDKIQINTPSPVSTSTGEILIGTGESNSGSILTETGEIMSGKIKQQEVLDWEEILIQERWISINPKIVRFQGGIIKYRYNGKFYSEEELREELKKELEIEIERRTKEHLNEIYSSETDGANLIGIGELDEIVANSGTLENLPEDGLGTTNSTGIIGTSTQTDKLYDELINSSKYNTIF